MFQFAKEDESKKKRNKKSSNGTKRKAGERIDTMEVKILSLNKILISNFRSRGILTERFEINLLCLINLECLMIAFQE